MNERVRRLANQAAYDDMRKEHKNRLSYVYPAHLENPMGRTDPTVAYLLKYSATDYTQEMEVFVKKPC